jgi:hypothetical protein
MSTPQQPGQSQSPVPVGTPAGGASSYGMMSPPQQQQPQVAAGQSMAAAGVDSTGVSRACTCIHRLLDVQRGYRWLIVTLSIHHVLDFDPTL